MEIESTGLAIGLVVGGIAGAIAKGQLDSNKSSNLLETKNNQINSLIKEKELLLNKNTKLSEEIEYLQEENARIKKKFNQHDDLQDDLKDELEDTKTKIEKLKKKIKNYLIKLNLIKKPAKR
ncbi:hypothetical protein [Ornithobacterium rhinotracheale]|uniref:hypothetical protein n=1 Tax=Ornithobacterium rhinotracheale TaxID=28251 RepID=UPI001FF5D8AB|nr:hypothetical protein [Ornithobacterium rhinotracheale]MCK0204585.1 hypothetical protein [Ornithobacterium rhinotracheale]